MVPRRQSGDGRVTPKAKSKVSALDAHLGYWLRFVSNQVSHSFSLKLESQDVTVAEWVLLRELYDFPSAAPSAIADSMGMTRGAISKLADRLVAKALITRAASETDRRYQALALTSKGRALVPKLAALADENDAEFFGHLKVSDRQKIEEIMRGIVRRHGLNSVPTE
jgi:DNA-binding MarR family transcriptional regulator